MKKYLFLAAFLALFANNYALADRSEQPSASTPVQQADMDREHARQLAEWEAARQKMREINRSMPAGQARCDALWNVDWPLAKAGNLEARYSMYNSFVEDWLKIVGRPADRLSSVRDIQTLFFHSLGSEGMRGENIRSKEAIYADLIRFLPLFAENTEFKNCMLNRLSQECAQIAVENKLIPSFEEFAADIDMYLKNGAHLWCSTDQTEGE